MIRNKKTHYGLLHVLLHWGMAGIIFFLFGSGIYMVDLGYYDAGYTFWPLVHKSLGLLLAALLVIRLFSLIFQTKPKPLAGHARWEIILAHSTHGLLYLLMAVLVVTGYLIASARGNSVPFFDFFTVPAVVDIDTNAVKVGKAHLAAAVALMALVALHALGALKHAIIDRDGTLKRMFAINPEKS